jgi:hypothetical protein
MTRTPTEQPPVKPPKSIARWVAGVVGVCSGGATIYGMFADKHVAVVAFIGMIFAIVLLLVVRRGIQAVGRRDAKFYDLLVKGLILFVLVYFMALTVALFPALYKWLRDGESANRSTLTPSPTPAPVPTPSVSEQPLADLANVCKAPNQSCTVFVFDYLPIEIEGNELERFQTMHANRLDKGIRNDLREAGLLNEIDFRVVRCSAVKLTEALADRAIQTLKVPAIMWGSINKRGDGSFVSVSTISLLDNDLRQLGSREKFGNDITEVLDLPNSLKGNPLAMASLVVGDIHLKNGRPEFARKAFLHAKVLAAQVDEGDRADFLEALKKRLDKVEVQNPVALLQPIGATN